MRTNSYTLSGQPVYPAVSMNFEQQEQTKHYKKQHRSPVDIFAGILAFASLFFGPFAFGQLVVNELATNATMTSLIQGSGVTITNFVITKGTDQQVSSFVNTNGTNNPLTIANGVLLSTGRGNNAVGANNNGGISTNYNVTWNDPDLMALGPLANKDVVIVEFDVTPKTDTLQLQFQFGSEEYLEYTCSSFNDVFAFLVSGPGISGPYANNAANFAKLPDNTPVSIGTVNQGVAGSYGTASNCASLANAAYFTNNTGNALIQADGITKRLSVKGLVQPCSTYHVKCVLADAGDNVYDSFVWLDGFTALGQAVTFAPLVTNQTLIEGCNSVTYQATRVGDMSVPLTVSFTYTGTATNNTDYYGAPNSISFAAGEATRQFTIYPLQDALTEGTETLNLNATWNVCASAFTVTYPLSIADKSLTVTNTANVSANVASGTCEATVNYTAPTAAMNCGTCYSSNSLNGYTFVAELNGQRYFRSNTSMTWAQADLAAKNLGGHLLSITNAAEAAVFNGLAAHWIGYNDQVTEGTWRWCTGETAAYTNWMSGEPNNASTTDQDFAVINANANGQWADFASTSTYPYILEYDCAIVTRTTGPASGSSFPEGTTTITHTATMASGQTASSSFNVVVTDNIAPQITCPTAQTVSLGSTGSITLADYRVNATATDNCTGTITKTQSPAQGTVISGVGATNVTITATDAAGNVTSCTFQVNRIDNTIPTITCPANVTVSLGSTCNHTLADYRSNATASDNVTASNALVRTQSPAPGTVITGGGVTPVTITVQDAAGNVASCTFNVTRQENTPPTITCPSMQSINLSSSGTLILPNYVGNAIMSDNCTPTNALVRTMSPLAGTVLSGTGQVPITMTSTDGAGNATSCTFNLNKVDNSAPIIACLGNQTLTLGSNCMAVLPDYRTQMTITDNVTPLASLAITQSPSPGTNYTGTGSQTITITATDGSSNVSTCSFSVSRVDTSIPVITCPSNQTLVASGSQVWPDYRSMATYTDNCTSSGNLVKTQSPAPGSAVAGSGNQIVTITAVDAAGNSGSCTFSVSTGAPTSVSFAASAGVANENGGTATVNVQIANPSSVAATTVQVALASGSNAAINNYATQTVTFPAGSSAAQTVTFTITNNATCGANTDLAFALQNVTGGNSASIGASNTYALTINDEDQLTVQLADENAEDNNLAGWNGAGGNTFAASSSSSINGSASIRSTSSDASGESFYAMDMDNALMYGVRTTWQMQIDYNGQEPTTSNYFMYYLAASSNTLTTPQNGYAVGVMPGTANTADILSLFRIDNGTPVAIVTSTIDWNTSHDAVGIKVVREANGQWKLHVKETGGFAAMALIGTVTDANYKDIAYTGMYHKYTSATSDKLSFDDVSILQEACPYIWYSQSTGTATNAIWAQSPTGGTAQVVSSSRYDSFVIQSNHNVAFNNYFVAKDLTVQTGGTISAGNSELIVCGNLAVNGTLTTANGSIRMKGNQAQNITTSASLTLGHLVIDNDGSTVSLPSNVETFIKEGYAVTIPEGTLLTNNKLSLRSNATATASIGEIKDAGTLTGQITLYRYIPPRQNYPYGSWVAVGCPLQGVTVNDWNDDLVTTGFLGSDNPPPYSFNNIQWYNEAVTGSAANGYTGVLHVNNTLAHDKGYFVYMQTPAQNLDVTGTIQHHSFNQPLQYTNTGSPGEDGWNLLVNQYPSEIDLSQMVSNGAGIATYYVFDAESNNYKYYNANIAVGTGSRYVASGQSFMVKANATGAYVRYEERFKTNTGATFEREMPQNSFVNLKITGSNGTSDECILNLRDDSGAGYDWQKDAKKLMSTNASAAECAIVSTDNTLLSIDTRPATTTELMIPVYAKMPVAGTYTFKVVQTNNLPWATCIYVRDVVTNNIIPLTAGQQFTIAITTPYTGNRFMIHVSPEVVTTVTNSTCNRSDDGSIAVDIPATGWNTTLTSSAGSVIGTSSTDQVWQDLPAGSYNLQIASGTTACPAVTRSLTIEEPAAASIALLNSVVDHCNTDGVGAMTCEITNAPGAYHYDIKNESGEVMAMGDGTESTFSAQNLMGALYQVVVTHTCGKDSIAVNLKDPNAVIVEILSTDVEISMGTGDLVHLDFEQNTENAESFLWEMDNGYTSHDETFGYDFEDAGSYVLALEGYNEHCLNSDEVAINVLPQQEQSQMNDAEYEVAPLTMITSNRQMAFKCNINSTEKTFIRVFDMSGKLVWYIGTSMSVGKIIEVSDSNFAPGAYVINAYVGDKMVYSNKIAK
jgi:Lectin C-type domain/HYR domain/Calx-beta domain